MVWKRNLCYIPLYPQISVICQSLHYSANITGNQTNTQIRSFLHYRRGFFLRKKIGSFKIKPYICSTRTPKPLNDAKIGGRFIFILWLSIFHKTYQSPTDIVALLQRRGLDIENPKSAEHYIRNIGYYRLSAYLYPLLKMPKEAHLYKAGCSFQDALNLYRFDKVAFFHE